MVKKKEKKEYCLTGGKFILFFKKKNIYFGEKLFII